MEFRFYPLRFEFIARESLFFPHGKAANILRGAFGLTFRSIVCSAACLDARRCERRQSCPYATIFEPTAQEAGPSGLADRPRPFVFRARHLDGQTIPPEGTFHFDLNVLSDRREWLPFFVDTFAVLAEHGFGRGRGKAEMRPVAPPEPQVLSLNPITSAPARMRVEFLSPTELKVDQRIALRPEFGVLYARIRDRIAMLSRLYGAGPLDLDYVGSNARAAEVRMIDCDVRRIEWERRSSRTGQSHSLGGFTGSAEYEGDLGEFLPWLEAARWTGVGRQAVWGKGEIRVIADSRR